MSEIRYTPEQMREWADSPNSSHSTAAMLRQAATDAEALAAKDKEIENWRQQFDGLAAESKRLALRVHAAESQVDAKDAEIARLKESRDGIITRNAEMFQELRRAWPALGRCVQQKEALQESLTAQRQKVRELREKLVKRQDAHTRDINEGDEELEEMRRSCILSIQATLDDMDALGLDGSHGG